MNIQGVLLDVGGTMIHTSKPVGQIYAEAAERFGGKLDPLSMQSAFGKAFKDIGSLEFTVATARIKYEEWWRQIVFKSLERGAAGASAEFLQRKEEYFQYLYQLFTKKDMWQIYPDVIPTLTSLKSKGLKTAIVSNWDHRLRPLLRELDLELYFDAIVISCEVGYEKPDPRIFHHAADRLNLAPETLVHIGDSRKNDFEGAHAAGITSLLIARPEQNLTDLLNEILSLPPGA
ncbi:MAG: HAD-IA family hydrolase [Verrucomicrobiota bacterium]|nr:HAD-IA family hydrolase [Verrucomicrobiota bacterium]